MISPESPGLRWTVGENAIGAFERSHRLHITIHDLVGTLGPFLPPDRFHHRCVFCVAVKAHRSAACAQFDIGRVRKDLVELPQGRIHICHAGVVEWTVPVFENGKLNWVIFAGPRFPGPDLVSAVRPVKAPWSSDHEAKTAPFPAPVGEAEAQIIMEQLRQLAARLRAWVRELHLSSAMTRSMPDGSTEGAMTAVGALNSRRLTILRFIEEKYNEPVTLAMLARRLSLSPSRTSHSVRRSCHASLRELLLHKRLRVAMDLLRGSGISVLDVSLACGFGDVAHFHRLFRRRVGLTPGRYRASAQAQAQAQAQAGPFSSEDRNDDAGESLRSLPARLPPRVAEAVSARETPSAAGPALVSTTARRIAVVRFIAENYREPVTLGMLAQRLELSESRASHVVRTSCDGTFRDLLIEKRLAVAKEFLRQSEMSVAEVAAASGFENVANFHRIFRRRIGPTPAEYRIKGDAQKV